jgi:NAD(P)-dependent dehydrogenase (short-subunit alcohol dehydrogenase family)
VTGRLADRACFITGGGSGIGRATSIRFAEEGARVAVADVDVAAARETVQLAVAASDRVDAAVAVRLDVTDPASCAAAVSEVIGAMGRIDVLFNNAGIAGVGTVEETSLDLWERVFAVAVRGVFLVAKPSCR